MARKARVTVSMDSSILDRIDRMAEAQRLSRSHVVERLIIDGLEATEGFVNMMANPLLRETFAKALGTPGVVSELADAMKGGAKPEDVERVKRAMQKVAQQATGTDGKEVSKR